MSYFRIRPSRTDGHYEIVATTDVPDKRNGNILYRGGEVVPYSEVNSKKEAERYGEFLNHLYDPTPDVRLPPQDTGP